MKICHIVLSLEPGGLERAVLSLIKQQLDGGNQVTVLCLERPGRLAAEASALGAGVHCIHKFPGLSLSTVRDLRRRLVEIDPDVIHSHQIGALFYAGPAARQVNIPVIVHTEHGKHYEIRRRTRWLGRWSSRYAQRFFCVSRDIACAVTARRIAAAGKVSVVENGIDTARFGVKTDTSRARQSLGIPAAAPVVGSVGRLAPVKCQDVLLKGFSLVPPIQGVLPHLVLVGGGPMEGDLRLLAASLGIAERVHFTGYQTEPERFLQIMDVFALTSSSEGMPLAVLESWAAGVPVVSSRVGGLVELIQENRTGRLFEMGNTQELGNILGEILADEDCRRLMGIAGRDEVCTKYDVSVMAKQYERHYRELLNPANGKRRNGMSRTQPQEMQEIES